MNEIDYLIEYENENTNLDFKRSEYGKDGESLLKDVMSMANVTTQVPKYIIIGVKKRASEEKEIYPLDSVADQADLENLIQENIEYNVNFV